MTKLRKCKFILKSIFTKTSIKIKAKNINKNLTVTLLVKRLPIKRFAAKDKVTCIQRKN